MIQISDIGYLNSISRSVLVQYVCQHTCLICCNQVTREQGYNSYLELRQISRNILYQIISSIVIYTDNKKKTWKFKANKFDI